MELFLKYPHDVQKELLQQLIVKAKDTEIGKKYQFSSITNYTEFTNKVPIQQYESIESLIERTRKGEQNLFWRVDTLSWWSHS